MSTCVISGTFLDVSEVAIVGATVRFNIEQPGFNSGGVLMVAPKEISTVTASDGTWSLTCSQLASGSITLDCPPNSSSEIRRYVFSVVIPATATANFSQIWADSLNLQSATYPLTFNQVQGTLLTSQLPPLADGQVYVGNSLTVPTPTTLSGAATLSDTGVLTLGAAVVANSNLANAPANTVKANLTGSAAAPQDVTLSALSTALGSGNALAGLSGDVTATGPGVGVATLATVNSGPGTVGSATAVPVLAVNGKGLVTSSTSTAIQIAESQVTNLTSDLAGKQATGNYVTALTGDATGSGPGSTAVTLATVNSTPGSYGTASAVPTLTTNAKGLVTASGSTAIQITESQVTNLTSDLAGKQPTGNYITSLTGDVTASGAGAAAATIANGAVTNAKMANMAADTIKGNNTGSSAAPIDLSQAQFTALVNPFTSLLSGAAPASGGGTTNFLRADGSWAGVGTPSPLTTKGDSYTYSTTGARQPVPGDYGRLIPDSSQATGWRSAPYSAIQNGRPGKNYVQYADFENNATTGYSLGTIGTLTNGLPTGSPTFGSGAQANLALYITTGLSGTYGLSFGSTAALVAGNMVATDALTIDPSDQAKVLSYRFSYKAVAGTLNFSGTSSNTLGVAVYDVTNSQFLGLAGAFSLTQSSGIGTASGTFQTAATTASIRFIVYVINATSGAAGFAFDDFYVGPQTLTYGPAMTDYVAYTPVTVGLGTPSNVSFFSRRVGDSLEVVGFLKTGTATATAIQIGLGFNGIAANCTVDTTKLAAANICGEAGISGNSTTYFGIAPIGPTSNATFVQLAIQSSTTSIAGSGAAVTGTVIGNSVNVTVHFTVPIVGWSSNSAQSSDTDTRVIGCTLAGTPTGTLNSSFNVAKFPTVTNDTVAGYSTSTGIYTCQVTGLYDITGAVAIQGNYVSGNTAEVAIYINSTLQASGLERAWSTVSATSVAPSVALLAYPLKAGDQVYLAAASSTSSPSYVNSDQWCYFSLSRRSGPAVVAATESVNMRYYSSSTTVSGTLATVMYSTKGWDTHNGYNSSTGIYTAPVSGKYQVNASIAMTGTFVLNSILDLQVQQTGSGTQTAESKSFAGGAITQMNTNVGDIFYMQAGDTLKVQASNSGTAPVIAATTTQNWISLARVGN